MRGHRSNRTKERAKRGEVPWRLMNAALWLIERHGLGNLSVAAIAAHARLYTPQFYKHWKRLGGMLEELATRETVSLSAALGKFARGSGPWQRVCAMIAGYVTIAHEHPASVMLLNTRGLLGGYAALPESKYAALSTIEQRFIEQASSLTRDKTRAVALGLALGRLTEGYALQAAREHNSREAAGIIHAAQTAAAALVRDSASPMPHARIA